MPRIHVNEWPPYAPSNQNSKDCSLIAAKLMMNAAQTAPVTGGVDNVEGEIVYGHDELDDIARKMEELAYSLENKTKEDQWKYEAVMVREIRRGASSGELPGQGDPLRPQLRLCAAGPWTAATSTNEGRVAAGQIDITDRSLCKTAIDGPLCGVRVG